MNHFPQPQQKKPTLPSPPRNGCAHLSAVEHPSEHASNLLPTNGDTSADANGSPTKTKRRREVNGGSRLKKVKVEHNVVAEEGAKEMEVREHTTLSGRRVKRVDYTLFDKEEVDESDPLPRKGKRGQRTKSPSKPKGNAKVAKTRMFDKTSRERMLENVTNCVTEEDRLLLQVDAKADNLECECDTWLLQFRTCLSGKLEGPSQKCLACISKQTDKCRHLSTSWSCLCGRYRKTLDVPQKLTKICATFAPKDKRESESESVSTTNRPTRDTVPKENKETILKYCADVFLELNKQDVKLAKRFTGSSTLSEPTLVEKLPGIRNLCDQCTTSLTDMQAICLLCGAEICLDCCDELENKQCDDKSESLEKVLDKYRSLRQPHAHKLVQNAWAPQLHLIRAVSPTLMASLTTKLKPYANKRPERVSHPREDAKSEWLEVCRLNAGDPNIRDTFLREWKQGHPVVVNVGEIDKMWHPEELLQNLDVAGGEVLNELGEVNPHADIRDFFLGFHLPHPDERRRHVLKVKDFPPDAKFQDVMKEHYLDFLRMLPMKEYSLPDGNLNLAAYTPPEVVPPDLGPKAYLSQKRGYTPLHLDMSDAVNILLHCSTYGDDAPVAKDDESSWKEFEATALRLMEEQGSLVTIQQVLESMTASDKGTSLRSVYRGLSHVRSFNTTADALKFARGAPVENVEPLKNDDRTIDDGGGDGAATEEATTALGGAPGHDDGKCSPTSGCDGLSGCGKLIRISGNRLAINSTEWLRNKPKDAAIGTGTGTGSLRGSKVHLPPSPRFEEIAQDTGAVWHIFPHEHGPIIRRYEHERRDIPVDPLTGELVKLTGMDPIHDQNKLFDEEELLKMKQDHGVRAWRIEQRPGDAVFIPAGCPHQVNNVRSCIKIAEDFISPENVDRCVTVTREFRNLKKSHPRNEDRLQVRTTLLLCLQELLGVQPTEPSESATKNKKFVIYDRKLEQ